MGHARRAAARAVPALLHELTAASPWRRWTARLQVAYLLGMLMVWVMLLTLSERWLPATLLAYGPRVVLLAPVVLLTAAAVLFSWRSLVFSALSALVVIGPIMGYQFIGARGAPPPRVAMAAGTVRVISLNAQGGEAVRSGLPFLLATYDPDVLLVQECGEGLSAVMQSLTGVHVHTERGLCLLSRWPIAQTDSMPRENFQQVRQFGFGGSALVMHAALSHPDGVLHVVNLHLETARKGLEGLVGSDGVVPDGAAQSVERLGANLTTIAGTAEANAAVRDAESRAAARWASEHRSTGPLIVAGDFNLPTESSIFRAHWHGFQDAFVQAGQGFGYTKIEGRLLRVRIDHVLTFREDADVLGAWVGADVGSDHRPLIVDLRVRRLR